MLIGNDYTSSKVILSRVYRDTGITSEIPFSDSLEWIFEALQELNAPLQYVNKIVGWKERDDYNFSSYKIKLPCDFHRLRGVMVDGVIALPSTNNWHQLQDGACCGFQDLNSTELDMFTDNFGITFQGSGFSFSNLLDPNLTFSMNSNYMTFSWKRGKACMSYYALPVDDEGYPLLPKDILYEKYLSDYVTSKLTHILWRQGMVSDKVYQDGEEKRMWSAGQVSAKAKIPDEIQAEGLKRQLIRLVPQFNEWYSGFNNMNRDRSHLG